jgi:hypothetical protein
MEKLPMVVDVNIASRTATVAADPMEDLGSLRATYSQMRRVCSDARSGTEHTTAAGAAAWDTTWDPESVLRPRVPRHPEACFYAGMHAIFVEDRSVLMLWLDMLECSADEDITPTDTTIDYKVHSFLHLHSNFGYSSLGFTCTCRYLNVSIKVELSVRQQPDSASLGRS